MTPVAVPAIASRSVASLAPAFGIYVHIPFCAAKCPYCDFNTYAGIDELGPAYLEALVGEAQTWASHGDFGAAGSMFIGGGTPTLLDPHALARALDRITAVLPLAPGAEVTVEANPESVDAGNLRLLRDAGVNRISIGAQSFSNDVLGSLGRLHDAEATKRAYAAARDAGLDNVNLDLIFGTPGESEDEWDVSLREAIALRPDHVSCYSLTIEPATAFGAAVRSGRMRPPDEDVQASRYECALDALAAAGYEHYEISNWGTPSRHNLVYWTQGGYVGLGAGAHSYVGGVRSWNRKNPRSYVDDPAGARYGEERLDDAGRAAEWLQLRLRLIEGVDLADAQRLTGTDLHAKARPLVDAGLVEIDGDRLRLTRRGILLENEVAIGLT